MKIGCHLSSVGGYTAMAQTAESIGANVFQFFTRNPRGGASKPVDPRDVSSFLAYSREKGIGPILAHAPYTLNAAGADPRVRAFAESVMRDDFSRLSLTPGAMYNFHPGCHVGQGAEKGMDLVSTQLASIVESLDGANPPAILIETMSGKGSELGGDFGEIRRLIDLTGEKSPSARELLGVCLDTCHVWDAGYDIVGDLDAVIEEFDAVVGIGRLKAVHLNDSMNSLGSRKDRHEKIGKGKIGLEAFERIINHPLLRHLPFYLETPSDLQGYKEEIALLKGLYR